MRQFSTHWILETNDRLQLNRCAASMRKRSLLSRWPSYLLKSWIKKLFFLHLLVTYPQCSTYIFRDLQSNAHGQDACRVSTDFGPDRIIRAGLRVIYCQLNVRAAKRDDSGKNTKDTHRITRQKLRFLTPSGLEPGPSGRKAGILPITPQRQVMNKNSPC